MAAEASTAVAAAAEMLAAAMVAEASMAAGETLAVAAAAALTVVVVVVVTKPIGEKRAEDNFLSPYFFPKTNEVGKPRLAVKLKFFAEVKSRFRGQMPDTLAVFQR